MNKRMNLYASLVAIALASGVTTSCSIDDTYDLDKEFDMTVGLGSEGLSLRLGNTEHVMLNDVLDIEDNDLVETDGQNLYYLVKTDHTSFDVSVKNAIGSIEHVEINSSQDVVSFDDFDNPDGASSVVSFRKPMSTVPARSKPTSTTSRTTSTAYGPSTRRALSSI